MILDDPHPYPDMGEMDETPVEMSSEPPPTGQLVGTPSDNLDEE